MRPRGLRARLLVVYTGAAAALIGVFALVAVQALDHNLRATLDSTLAARATPYLQALADPGTPDLPATVQDAARRRVTNGLAVVIDPRGRVRQSEPASAAAASVVAVLPRGDAPATELVDRTVAGERLRLRVDRVSRADGTWTVVVGVGAETTDAAAEKVRDALEVGAPALLLVILAGTWLLGNAALRPVERMRAQAASLGASDSQTRLDVPDTGDELHALGVTFNDLLDRLHQSLAQQRDFVADAGHELRTPLAIMCAELELADRPNRTPQELREAIAATRIEANRLKDLAENLLLLAADDRRPRERVELADVISDAVAAHRPGAERAGIRLLVVADRSWAVLGEAAALRRGLDNLLSNALDHAGPRGRVEVRMTPVGTDRVKVQVLDTGPGFPPEFLPHAFDRFRRADTARTSRTSTGLGLAIVAAIVTAHGGQVSAVNNDPGPGACVSLILPRIPEAAREPTPGPAAALR
jgi:two-component system, OmpR family, sensor kinase